MQIVRSKGGSKERTVELDEVEIPDLWAVAQQLRETDPKAADAILETWRIAHDLRRTLLGMDSES